MQGLRIQLHTLGTKECHSLLESWWSPQGLELVQSCRDPVSVLYYSCSYGPCLCDSSLPSNAVTSNYITLGNQAILSNVPVLTQPGPASSHPFLGTL